MCCMYLGGSGGDGGKGQRGKTNLDKVPARPASGNAQEVYDRGVPDPNHPEDQLSTSIYDLVLIYVCHFHHHHHPALIFPQI